MMSLLNYFLSSIVLSEPINEENFDSIHKPSSQDEPRKASRLMDVNEFASRCDVAPITIRRAVKEGRITHLRIGDLIRFSEDNLIAYLEECTVFAKPKMEKRKLA